MSKTTLLTGGEEIFFKGRTLFLLVVKEERLSSKVELNGDRLIIRINQALEEDASAREIERRLRVWLRKTAKETILGKLDYYKKQLAVEFNEVRVKEQKTRWGSCSQKGNLNFNWRLVSAPEEVIDYVVVHELCHLVHMNHSKNFWSLVGNILPDYKQLRKWLKVNGRLLGLPNKQAH